MEGDPFPTPPRPGPHGRPVGQIEGSQYKDSACGSWAQGPFLSHSPFYLQCPASAQPGTCRYGMCVFRDWSFHGQS